MTSRWPVCYTGRWRGRGEGCRSGWCRCWKVSKVGEVQERKRDWAGVAVHVGAWVSLGVLAVRWVTGQLTADPVRAAILSTGRTAITLLVLSLACTPVGRLGGWHGVRRARKPLGLYGFGYAALHLALFVGVDYGFDWRLIAAEIAGKRFLQAGLMAFALLLPLAWTSTRGWQRRLGRWWAMLHRLVYLAVPVAVLHWVWSLKVNRPTPWVYGAVVLVLLLLRVYPLTGRKSAG